MHDCAGVFSVLHDASQPWKQVITNGNKSLLLLLVAHKRLFPVTSLLFCCRSFCPPPLHAVGAFDLVPAYEIKPGDTIVVALTSTPGKADFAAVSIDKSKMLRAPGLYLPIIEEPYLVVDGVVSPL